MIDISGRVIRFGDNIDTDIISPGKWMHEGMEILKKHAFEAIRPDFYKEVQKGDILVAGQNFGYGSHREQANSVLKAYGIAAVVADSINRIYFRNCIALGIPAIIFPGVSKFFEEGDIIKIYLSAEGGSLAGKDGLVAKIPPLQGMVYSMLVQGGIMPVIMEKMQSGIRQEG